MIQAARARIAKAEADAERQLRRKDYLAYRGRYEERLGFNILEHHEGQDNMADVVRHVLRKEILTMKRKPPLDTHDRIFGKKPVVNNPLRTQHLYDQSIGGKAYNIVSHTAPQHWAPTMNERVNRRQAHPSQACLERGRSVQGAVTPSERCTTPFLDPWY